MSNYKTSWTELNLIERQMIPIMAPDYNKDKPVKWINFECDDPAKQWIPEANSIIMDFGGVFHSVFLRWAVTVNGLHIAAERYKSRDWIDGGKHFAITGIRNALDGSGPSQTHVRIWDGQMASEVHSSSIPMLAAWAFCNMYSCLEEFVFKLFRVYLEANPLTICRGEEFGHLRRMYREQNLSEAHRLSWNEAWEQRLNSWHRKKLYDNIEKVFNNFVEKTGIKIPIAYGNDFAYTDVAKTLGGIALIRNCFIHGVTDVPVDLGAFCSTPQSLFFDYASGEKFEITLHELATFEFFADTFTQTLNTSLFELAHPELKGLTSRSSGRDQ